MRLVLAFAIFTMACSDAAAPAGDAAVSEDAPADAAAQDVAIDSAVDAASDAAPTQGGCAACTANECLPELQACGGSQACLNDLVAFNGCLAAQSGDCGSSLAAGGAAQATLWSCLSTKCAASCGTK